MIFGKSVFVFVVLLICQVTKVFTRIYVTHLWKNIFFTFLFFEEVFLSTKTHAVKSLLNAQFSFFTHSFQMYVNFRIFGNKYSFLNYIFLFVYIKELDGNVISGKCLNLLRQNWKKKGSCIMQSYITKFQIVTLLVNGFAIKILFRINVSLHQPTLHPIISCWVS